jgi:hypothetical protein
VNAVAVLIVPHALPDAKLCHAADFFGNDVQKVRASIPEEYAQSWMVGHSLPF